MPTIGWFEILIIVALAIIIVGPKDFPLMLKKVGSWIGSVKRYVSNVQNEVSSITDDTIDKNLNGSFFRIKSLEFFIPTNKLIDNTLEKKKVEDELTYAKGFLKSVEEKLSNSKFVENAPKKIIDIEKKKVKDSKEKIKILTKSLNKFN